MNLHLQIGWGMRRHSRELVSRWGTGTVILSPRDMDPGVLRTYRDRFPGTGDLVLDPQMFDPEADYHRLLEHEYWPDEYQENEFWDVNGDGDNYEDVLEQLRDLNAELGCESVILPGQLLEQTDDDEWFTRQGLTQAAAREICEDGTDLFATIPVRPSLLRDQTRVHSLLRKSQYWDVEGIYLVAELPPGDEYFATDAVWLAGLFDLIAGYRIRDFDVILGHANQQMIAAMVAAPTAIASGTKKNVRHFELDRYYETEGGGGGARPVWYYAPDTLSEYRVSDLNIAQTEGLLHHFAPAPDFADTLADNLFSDAVVEEGVQPTAVGFDTGTSVQHYLDALRSQIQRIEADTLDDTAENVISLSRSAANKVEMLAAEGIHARETWSSDNPTRPDAASATVEAVRTFMNRRGPVFRRLWEQVSE